MAYQNIAEFFDDISNTKPEDLIQNWFNISVPHAFGSEEDYRNFLLQITSEWPDSISVCVAGSSNWRYSLNPNKNFSEYHSGSDIDVVMVSPQYFEDTWEVLRSMHRKHWYSWPNETRERVMRIGGNVYCGFISPKHIPDKSNSFRFSFLTKCNSYSSHLVGYRDVNMMFFKSNNDAIDYYVRGVRLAKRRM